MVYRLGSINANLDESTLVFDNGYKMELVTYLAGVPSHSTEDSFKIGKVVKLYGITWQDIEEEARELEANGMD
tara:strand:+ start:180 stop:398 length:219 start_codon:yes stop_codon:yes gene_type:complete